MKKIILVVALFGLISVINDFKNQELVIPKESIRFRVIANSNSMEDQELKLKVKDNLNNELQNILKNSNSLSESRSLLKNNIVKLNNNVNNTLKSNNSNETFTINYGNNYFPKKEYKGITYKEGKYESLVVKIGKGEGKNFWCVLFPPLCLIDDKKETTNNVEYRMLIKDVLSKYFNN